MTNELERAIEYRRKMVARDTYKRLREEALVGSQEAYDALWLDYAPLLPPEGWDNEDKYFEDNEA